MYRKYFVSRSNRHMVSLTRFLTLVLTACWLCAGSAIAQEVVPEFFVDAMSVRSADGPAGSTQVDLYTRVPFKRLIFLNSAEGFIANYVVTVEAVTRKGDRLVSTPMLSRNWEATARATAYGDTQSEELSSYTTQSLRLPPGQYQFSIQVEDANSSQVFVRDVDVAVRDLSASPSLSDLAILDNYNEAGLEFTPRVTNLVGTDEGSIEALYETYTDAPVRVRFRHQVIRLTRAGDIESTDQAPVAGTASGAELYKQQQEVLLERGRNQHVVTIPLEGIEVGPHLLRVQMESMDGTLLSEATRIFSARWTGLEQHVANIDEAIDQLIYIAKKKDISFIKEATTQADRYRRFRSFWEKRDPTPGTQRNERMEQYYYRMAFANQRYSSLVEGWKTDRGFVLVRFGEPDFIRKKPHSFDYEPYEVWVYERIGRQFIFVDKTGFGDYQLQVPIWDERTRLY